MAGWNDQRIADDLGCSPALVGLQIEVWHEDGTIMRHFKRGSIATRYAFDPEIAGRVGINAAVIYAQILWWCDRNEENKVYIRDGSAWVPKRAKDFTASFPFLTSKQVRFAIYKLTAANLIESRAMNAAKLDRTMWYRPISH